MEPDRSRVVSALTELSKAFTPIRWTTPLGLAHHRTQLADRVRRGDGSPYPERIEFGDPGFERTRAAAGEALAVATRLPDELRELVESETERTLEYTAAIASRRDDAITSWSLRHDGLPDDATIAEARRILALGLPEPEPEPEPEPVTVDTVTACFRDALSRHGLDDWRVSIEENMAARMSVLGSRNLVKIRSDIAVSRRELQRLEAHEVGGHVLRWANARQQPESLAAFAFGSTVATEEGLAALREEECGLSSPHTLHTYALRVVGVVAAQDKDLTGLAFVLSEYTDPDSAAELALRIRRGIGDPRRPGGMTKDHGYLTGLLTLREMPADDILLLRGVKWAMEHLDLVRRLAAIGRISVPLREYEA
ncbi:MAG TPA: tyrosine/phenylalanine carboxypeptidase domain-containing protein [Actinomycetaceae bacterium]|nr:tyrosine/phenylalanine carboxypeptidase domain-containing protein [Actinomycetaceae bacterium]